MSEVFISVTDSPAADDLAVIEDRLSSFNEVEVGPADHTPIAVLGRDGSGAARSGALVCGVYGYTAWGWLYTRWLWVAESHRGQGLTGGLLSQAEAEARARGCHGAHIDTFNPVALRVYERLGYIPFGELKDFPKGHTRTFLQKQL